MNAKRQRFVEEYLVDLNATQAAIRAGYSERSARMNGRRLLAYEDVREAVDRGRMELSERTGITMERVIRELERIAFADPRRVFKWGPDGVELIDSDSLTEDVAAIVSEVSESATGRGGVRIKRYDKLKALELLGKHLGGSAERKRVDITDTIDVFDAETRARLLEMADDDDEADEKDEADEADEADEDGEADEKHER